MPFISGTEPKKGCLNLVTRSMVASSTLFLFLQHTTLDEMFVFLLEFFVKSWKLMNKKKLQKKENVPSSHSPTCKSHVFSFIEMSRLQVMH